MPNHITNRVRFIGALVAIQTLAKATCSEESIFDFNAFAPMPEKLRGTTSPAKIVTPMELREWEHKLAAGELNEWEKQSRPITLLQSNELIREFGTNNWYDWACDNWGTKWGSYEVRTDGDEVVFQTAWACPVPAFIILSKQHPEVTIHVKYADEDFGSNVGEFKLLNGEMFDQEQPEYGIDSHLMAYDVMKADDQYDYMMEDDDVDNSQYTKLSLQVMHTRGVLKDTFTNVTYLQKLFDMAIADEQYERAAAIKAVVANLKGKQKRLG